MNQTKTLSKSASKFIMKSIVVTGGNKGIGFATVKKILADIPDSYVYIASRKEQDGAEAIGELVKENADYENRLKAVQLDISKPEIIKQAADFIKQDLNGGMLYALVNNAGFFSYDNMSECLNVNVRGTRNVTIALLPMIDPSKGRIVNVSSIAGPNFVSVCNPKYRKFFIRPDGVTEDTTKIWSELEDLMQKVEKEFDVPSKRFSPTLREMGVMQFLQYSKAFMVPYTFSKACLNLLTMLMAKDFSVPVNCVHPGPIWSQMTMTINAGDEETMRKKGLRSPEQGTIPIMKLLRDEQLKTSGEYYGFTGEVESKVQFPKGAGGALLGFIYWWRSKFSN